MTPGSLRVLHVLAPAPFGGLEAVVAQLVAGQRHAGHDVQVATMVGPDDPLHTLDDALRQGAVPVHRVRTSSGRPDREHRLLLACFAAVRPDVVHTHGYRADVLAGWTARRLGLVRVSTLHGLTSHTWRLRLYEQWQRMALATFNAVIAVSRSLGERLKHAGIPDHRLHVVPNAWTETTGPLARSAARERLGLDPGDDGHHTLGWVGRLSPEKGPDVFLRAVAALPDPTVAAVMVGDGPARTDLARLAEHLGIQSRVRWTGMLPHAGRVFPAFDAFVLSSHTEGTPVVLFEAMAAGVPIVTTNVGGVPDLLPPGTAIAVPAGNPHALAHAIQATLADPGAAAHRARTARDTLLTRHAVGPWLAAYERVYRAVARGTDTVACAR